MNKKILSREGEGSLWENPVWGHRRGQWSLELGVEGVSSAVGEREELAHRR